MTQKAAIIHLLQLSNIPIFQQLQIEEALLRADNRNWCIINAGSPPSIVMGISGKEELLLNRSLLVDKPIPVIRRFSGGGTVVVDEQTLFATFICNKECMQVSCCPDKIHQWASQIYKDVFHADFQLRENDYVYGDCKFGGNAQYLRKDRWLHHSSFLWDINPALMEYLLLPQKQPKYRQMRPHTDFLCKLLDRHSDKGQLVQQIGETLTKKFTVIKAEVTDIQEVLVKPHRKSTSFV